MFIDGVDLKNSETGEETPATATIRTEIFCKTPGIRLI
jgi:hypothetical protein